MKLSHNTTLFGDVTINGSDIEIHFDISLELEYYAGRMATRLDPEEHEELTILSYEITSVNMCNGGNDLDVSQISHTSSELCVMMDFLGLDYENIIDDYLDTEIQKIIKE